MGDGAELAGAPSEEEIAERRAFRQRTWKTRDGRLLLLTDMTDDHLENAILFCQRQLRSLDPDGDDLRYSNAQRALAKVTGEALRRGWKVVRPGTSDPAHDSGRQYPVSP